MSTSVEKLGNLRFPAAKLRVSQAITDDRCPTATINGLGLVRVFEHLGGSSTRIPNNSWARRVLVQRRSWSDCYARESGRTIALRDDATVLAACNVASSPSSTRARPKGRPRVCGWALGALLHFAVRGGVGVSWAMDDGCPLGGSELRILVAVQATAAVRAAARRCRRTSLAASSFASRAAWISSRRPARRSFGVM